MTTITKKPTVHVDGDRLIIVAFTASEGFVVNHFKQLPEARGCPDETIPLRPMISGLWASNWTPWGVRVIGSSFAAGAGAIISEAGRGAKPV